MKKTQAITEEGLSTAQSPNNFPKGSLDSQMSSVLKTEPNVADVEHFFLKMRQAATQKEIIEVLSGIQFP